MTVPMRFVALMSRLMLTRVRAVVPPTIELRQVRFDELLHDNSRVNSNGIIVDSDTLSEPAYERVVACAGDLGVRLIVVGSESLTTCSRFASIDSAVAAELLFVGEPGDAEAIGNRLVHSEVSVSTKVMRAISNRLLRLPEPLVPRAFAQFRAKSDRRSVRRFASSCKCTTQAVRRAFTIAGLSSPKTFLAAIALAGAHEALGDRSRPLEQIADSYGLGSGRRIERISHELLGVPPRHARRSLTSDQFANHLIVAIRLRD
jgi:hypothetical protein